MKLPHLALSALVAFPLAASAQVTATLQFAAYDTYLHVHGDRVNLRKAPSTQSPRLMSYTEPTEPPIEGCYFSNQKLKVADASPAYAYTNDVLPLAGTSGKWYKTVWQGAGAPGIDYRNEAVVYIYSQFASPTELRVNPDLKEVMEERNELEFPWHKRENLQRPSGKYQNLTFTLCTSNEYRDAYIAIPIRIDQHRILFVDAPFHPEEKTSDTDLFELIEFDDSYRAYDRSPIKINIGYQKDQHADGTVARNIRQALITCSDEDFELILKKEIARRIRQGDYDVFFVEELAEGSSELHFAKHYDNHPGARIIRKTISFDSNEQ